MPGPAKTCTFSNKEALFAASAHDEQFQESMLAATMENLDFAIDDLRDMKMQPSLERALGHREILRA